MRKISNKNNFNFNKIILDKLIPVCYTLPTMKNNFIFNKKRLDKGFRVCYNPTQSKVVS